MTLRGLLVVPLLLVAVASSAVAAPVSGWLRWRGPAQDGVSSDPNIPIDLRTDGPNLRWSVPVSSRGAPVVADGRLYVMAWRGEGPELRELLSVFDAESGKPLWEREFPDFLSDTIYERYSIGAPAIDPETGNVYVLSVAGLATAFDRDGTQLWQHSLMEAYGRLTFPNARTGAPVIDHDLVIYRGITNNWGAQGAPRDRFYAFDKRTGDAVWSSTPGDQPKDNSFSTGLVAWVDGVRTLYATTGCGFLVAINSRNGEALWRFKLAAAGVNASVVRHGRHLIAIHGTENVDASRTGRMVAIDPDRRENASKPVAPGEPPTLAAGTELWRNDLSAFSSSPVLVGDRVYVTTDTGELAAVDANTGKVVWTLKLAQDQVHASPVFAAGRLYVPMNDGTLHVVEPGADGGKLVAKVQLEGNLLGAPAVWDGRLYVASTKRLYAFGARERTARDTTPWPREPEPAPGPASALQARPNELLVKQGDSMPLRLFRVDAGGLVVTPASDVTFAKWVPPTAKVKSFLDASITPPATLVVAPDAKPSAGAFEFTAMGNRGTLRGRLVPNVPFAEDFESFTLGETHPTETGVTFAFPPLAWIGARNGWEVRDAGGSKVLAKTLDRIILQRSQVFMGHPSTRDVVVAADVMSDGRKRWMSSVGVVNQRYRIALMGNAQAIEVSSNDERLRVSKPFKWKPGTWYRLLTRVDVDAKGRGVIRAKAWPRGEKEPKKWTLEVKVNKPHQQGSPGLWGFAPQNQARVYVDNVSVTPAEVK